MWQYDRLKELPNNGCIRRPNRCTIVSMLADLAAVIEELDIPGDDDAVIEALALRDRLDARIALATGAVEAVVSGPATRRCPSPTGCGPRHG